MADADTFTAAVDAATGRPLDELTVTEALDVAERLRSIVAALPAPSPRDVHLAALLTDAAALVERAAGID